MDCSKIKFQHCSRVGEKGETLRMGKEEEEKREDIKKEGNRMERDAGSKRRYK
jgi:hypothetical protein